jgi:hypothetical protein
MKNLINSIFLGSVLFLIPLFTEGKSTERKSFISEIKENITKEKEKIEEKSQEQKQEKVEIKSTDNNHNKSQVEKPAEEESRITKVKKKIVKEKKKIETKVEKNKKEKDNYVHSPKYKNGYNRRYHRRKYKSYYYPDTYLTYDYYYPDVSYYDYYYVDDSELIYSRPTYEYNQPRKIISLNSSIEAAYLGKDLDDTYGVTAKISANLYSFYFNCFYQNVFSSGESLTLYSINGGYSFSLQNVTLTPFIGAFYIEPLEEAELSYGANVQIYLPDNYNLDLYSLNSSYGSLNFNNFSASLNHELYIFYIGMGFNYNNYAGISFSGPFAKLSFSL